MIAAAAANANDISGDAAARTIGSAPDAGSPPQQPASSCEALAGEWHNIDPATRSVTRIELSPDCAAGTATIQVWGACHPRDCTWRPFSGAYNLEKQAFFGRSTVDFKVAGVAIKADAKGHAIVTIFTHFTDNSNRKDYTSVDTMTR